MRRKNKVRGESRSLLTGRAFEINFERLVKVKRALGFRIGCLSTHIQPSRLRSAHLDEARCRSPLCKPRWSGGSRMGGRGRRGFRPTSDTWPSRPSLGKGPGLSHLKFDHRRAVGFDLYIVCDCRPSCQYSALCCAQVVGRGRLTKCCDVFVQPAEIDHDSRRVGYQLFPQRSRERRPGRNERGHVRLRPLASLGLVPDLDPDARVGFAGAAVYPADSYKSDTTDIQDDFLACELRLEVA